VGEGGSKVSLTGESLKRQNKIAEWETRIRLLHKKYPRLEEISELIAQIALQMALIELGKGKAGMEREEIIKANEALRAEKLALLEKYKLPQNIYDIWWDCEKCRDTGFVQAGIKCECRVNEEAGARWQMSRLSPEQKLQTFETFSLDYYPEKEKYRAIVDRCQAFAEKVAKGQETENLLISGPVGTGKTHICSAIANSVLQTGKAVIYLKTGVLLDLIRQARFYTDKNEQNECNQLMETLYRVPLLIIDDLGTENLTDFAQEQLLLLIDERINYHLPWVISTNLSLNEMDTHYELRLIDRIIGTSGILRFSGESIRQLKKMRK
jgi:DNA replication protein DnaC